jgi:hypothetical protein
MAKKPTLISGTLGAIQIADRSLLKIYNIRECETMSVKYLQIKILSTLL